MRIYFPATCEILTPGHIKCLEWLRDYKRQKHPQIIIGLLTTKALKGYKKVVVPFKDRKYILEHLWIPHYGFNTIQIVPQDSLNPSKNIEKYKPVAIASGDGWESEELEAIKKYKLIKININFPKKWSSSKVLLRRLK